jgi:hypothetical protein
VAQTERPGARLAAAGFRVVPGPADVTIAHVAFGSAAQRVGLHAGWQVLAVKMPAPRPSPYWIYLPALGLLAIVIVAQRARTGQALRP